MTRRQTHQATALMLTTDRGVLASCLAWPAFQKRWREGQWPEFLVHGIHI